MLSYADLAARVATSYVEAPKLVLRSPVLHASDDIRLVLDQREDELLVVVPGTTDTAGWLDDFAICPRCFPELGWYHDGFGSHGIALFAQLMEHLPVAGSGVLTTYIGHSLGAALAATMAALHQRGRFGSYRLVTFGEPRSAALWNFQVNGYLETARDHKRFVRAGDPVCHVPFAPLYKHTIRGSLIGRPTGDLDLMTNHSISLYESDLRALGC